MARIILVTPTDETSVGMIYSNTEAFQCAALLQALCTTPNYTYYVVYTNDKGIKVRKQPQPLETTVRNLKPLYELLRILYINEPAT